MPDERPFGGPSRARVACAAASFAVLVSLCALAIDTSTAAATHVTKGTCLVPGRGKPLDRIWRPNILSAVGYQRGRQGDIAFAVRTASAFYGYRPNHQEWSASVLKAMLMVAYLDRPSVAGRALTAYDKSLLYPMITRSDNNAANILDVVIGDGGLQALAARVGMTHFVAVQPIWGESEITAQRPDQVLAAHRQPHRAAPSRVRDASAGEHRAVRALGDRRGRAAGLEALLQGRLGLRHRPDRQPGGAAEREAARVSRSPC